MTEVMVHSLLDGSFSFTGSQFSHIQASNESVVESNEFEKSALSFNDKMDSTSDKSTGSTVCESDSNDSVASNARGTEANISQSVDCEDSANNTSECNTPREKYEILATKTTVINTTYNMISQSCAEERDIHYRSMEHSLWPISHYNKSPFKMNEAVDKSRVIVQILKSDPKDGVKSPNALENKSTTAENQTTHSFRDDMFKLLSKPRPKFDDGKSNYEENSIRNTLNVCTDFQSVTSEYQDTKTQVVRACRKRNLKSYFLNGKGAKISELKSVLRNIRQTSPNVLRYLHYIMFNSYGLNGTALQLLQTRKNISSFCGYPFKRFSEEFHKKVNCLLKLPSVMLVGIHSAIFGKGFSRDRNVLVNQLMDFLMKPKKCSSILASYNKKEKQITADEYAALKESALKGPYLTILLERLPSDDIKRLINDNGCERSETSEECESSNENDEMADDETSEPIPAYILNGPGAKLKCLSKIAKNVQNARDKHVKLLHYVLYGRVESDVEACKRNILEFNGFSQCQKEFVAERKVILKKLGQKELFQICSILCLRAKTNSRKLRIKKILDYLHSPSEPRIFFKPCDTSLRWPMSVSPRSGHLEGCLPDIRESYKSKHTVKKSSIVASKTTLKISKPNVTSLSTSTSTSSSYSDEIESDSGRRLRDFRTICTNIECAAPSDLTELVDLLFLRAYDESDIHQKILDFTQFDFSVNSDDYNYRKTLMHYMGMCTVKKIARLLDIENCDKFTNQEDLSSSILKFLVEKKGPDSPHSKSSYPNSPLESSIIKNPESPESFKSEVYQQQTNHAITHHKGNVIIQRLTKASVQTERHSQSSDSVSVASVQMDVDTRNESRLSCDNSPEDDSILLRDIIHHPSEQELKDLIYKIIKGNLWCFTLGDLVQKVYQNYEKVDLTYRETFIKAYARQILSNLREYAVDTVKHLNF